jgi:outer membrane autotransporter protein
MKRLAIAAAAALALLGGAHAQQMPAGLYGELGYTWLQVDGGNGIKVNPDAIRGILGWDFHPFFAVEGMLAGGVRDDSTNVTVLGFPTNVNIKLENTYGIYLKPKYDFNQWQAFARLGWARTKLRTEVNFAGATSSSSNSDDDFSWGLGANYRFNPRMNVGLDYMVYYDRGNTKVDGWTISFGYRF